MIQVWWAWAINDPATAVARVAGLGPDLMGSVLRAIGQFHPELKAGGTKPQAPPTPTAWVTQLGNSEPGAAGLSMPGYQTERTWDRGAIQEARAAFAQLPAEQKARAASRLSMEQGAFATMPELRADAFRWMLENPPSATPADAPSDRGIDLLRNASRLATEWARDDPQAASRWAQSLPAGDTRLWVLKNLARQWAEYEPAAAANWANTLPAAERAEVAAEFKAANPD